MKTIAFLASPRKSGNTELLLDEVIKGIKSIDEVKNKIEKIFLNEQNIKLCQGIEECRKTGECPLDDDCAILINKIKKAEMIILASPNYWSSYTAQLKVFLDRWGVFLDSNYQSRIEDKKIVFLAICGNPNKEHAQYVIDDMKKATSSLGLELAGELIASASNKGDILKNKEILKKAFDLGRKLALNNN